MAPEPSPELEDVVLDRIHDRETLLARLGTLRGETRGGAHGGRRRAERTERLLRGLHDASLSVCEALSAWNVGRQDGWARRERDEARARRRPPYNFFTWDGRSYLRKMLSDTDFVADIPEAAAFLGSSDLHRNPLLLPLGIDLLVTAPSLAGMRLPWPDVSAARARRAALVLLLDEHHRLVGEGARPVTPVTLFHPPALEASRLGAYTALTDPPAGVVFVVTCAHLVLGSVVAPGLATLTRPIMLSVFVQDVQPLVDGAGAFNPLKRVDDSVLQIVARFVLHPGTDPSRLARFDGWVADLSSWLRGLVTRQLPGGGGGEEESGAVAKIFKELDADHVRFSAIQEQLTSRRAGTSDGGKENPGNRHSISVQTEPAAASPEPKAGTKDAILREILGTACEPDLLPLPLFVTVNVDEDSRVVTVNGDFDQVKCLQSGDIVRLYDAHESPNWKVSAPPSLELDGGGGTVSFHLSAVYDHSRIIAEEARSRHDSINRLCYPYRRGVEKTPILPSTAETTMDERRHVAVDPAEAVHSPLHIESARIWKMIPRDEDTRPPWRREYDCGTVPWNDVDSPDEYRRSAEHFRVRSDLEVIERSCFDSPYPAEHRVHQQRVDYFESIPVADVIDEAFETVCRWHPVGKLVDNVKWAKLSRKMRFLSNVKNSKHEIDMAFVRHNLDRKLDLKRFHAIFEDIASTQHPSLPAQEAVSKVVWASIVMLPDVKKMMWNEAKRMSIEVEVRRVCAQTRIAARVRARQHLARYLEAKAAAVVIASRVRQYLARLFVTKLLRHLRESEEYKLRTKCARAIQTEWRRYFWRSRFLGHQREMLEDRRRKIAELRARLREKREREQAAIVYRDIVRIEHVFSAVTIYFYDECHLDRANTMVIEVYVPASKETFRFELDEGTIRETLRSAAGSGENLSWDEMLRSEVLCHLSKRLMLRVVRGRPIFLFSRRNLVEQGVLIDKRVIRAEGAMFILSTFRSPHEVVFYTYQPKSREQLRARVTAEKLRSWIDESSQSCELTASDLHLIHPRNQDKLVEWLVKRVVVRNHPIHDGMQLLLQYEAEEERITKLVVKVQAQWRRLKSKRTAKDKALGRYEKIFVREYRTFAYRDLETGERQWSKPKLLGEVSLADPVDEWREEVSCDPETGVATRYFVNHATGQSSWFSEEDAARMVQRRFRQKHESDIIGAKIQLPDIVKAVKFIQEARGKYEQEPTRLANIVNYALLTHCIDLDFVKARVLYGEAMMASPRHPLICRAFGIFLLATRHGPPAETFQRVCRMLNDAAVVDPTVSKFDSAAEIYFRWAVLVNSKNPLVLLNYALLYQCVYKKYDIADKIYRTALSFDPCNTLVFENYELFTSQRYPGGEYECAGPPISVVNRSTILETKTGSEWSKRVDPECPRPGFEVFYYNRFTKETRFEAPDWDKWYKMRVSTRSKIVGSKTGSLVEYFDTRTETSFFYDLLTKRYQERPGNLN